MGCETCFGPREAAMLKRFILWRVVGMIVVLIAMTFLVFLLRQVVPSDPARAAVGPYAPQAVVDAKRTELGLNEPLPVQYWRYLRGLLHGDLGRSVTTLNPVTSDIRRALPASAELLVFATILALILAIALALAQTLFKRSELFRQVLVGGASAPI